MKKSYDWERKAFTRPHKPSAVIKLTLANIYEEKTVIGHNSNPYRAERNKILLHGWHQDR